MGYDAGQWGAGQWLVMALMMLLFWGSLIALAVWSLNGRRRDADRLDHFPGSLPSDADRVLDGRFARGEIDREEYVDRRELLHGSPPRS